MIAAVLFVNQKGEVVISRMYRDGFSRSVADTFRSQVIASKEVRARAGKPILVVVLLIFFLHSVPCCHRRAAPR